MRTLIAVQGRLGSKRFPRKILEDLDGSPMIAQVARRCRAVKDVGVLIACPEKEREEIFTATGIGTIGGPEDDLLTRLLNAADYNHAEVLVRVTADCPLICHDLIEHGLRQMKKYKARLVQNWRPRVWPDGFDFEVWEVKLMRELSEKLTGGDREWFAQWALDHGVPSVHLPAPPFTSNLQDIRLTVDKPEDLDVVRVLYGDMRGEVWGAELVVRWCLEHPKLVKKSWAGSFGARPVDFDGGGLA